LTAIGKNALGNITRLMRREAATEETGTAPARSATAFRTEAPNALLEIDCPDPTAEDAFRQKHIAKAQFLVRQERWSDLSDLLRTADADRNATPGAMPLEDLYAYGARADVILAAEHALIGGSPDPDAPILAGIEALEAVLEEHGEDYAVAAVVAQAHMDLGWAWRGTDWDEEVPEYNLAVFNAHFERAEEILQDFDAVRYDSPLLAAAHCALLAGCRPGNHSVAERYHRLIQLNPGNPQSMRALGSHLLPRWHGSLEDLELEARRTALRTQDTWGAGGYTWVQFDAITCDENACANLDVDFFIDELHDILDQSPDAHTANLLAAYCANAVGQARSGNAAADAVRQEIADCATWIVKDHLTELHPMIWAHAARGFDNNLRVYSAARFAASGREDAVRIITGLFRPELGAGKRIVFTESGPEALTA
jgi:hypothetical protein